jgi:DNA-binding NtrC family response regulator
MQKSRPTSILLVEDDAGVRSALAQLLGSEGHRVLQAGDAASATETMRGNDVGIVLLDLGLPDMDGQDLLPVLRRIDDQAVFVVLTGRGSIETVVESMRRGADNFLVKPTDATTLVAAVNKAQEQSRLRRRDLIARSELERRGLRGPVGSSHLMNRVRGLVDRVAVTDSSVVLVGESGTGKGMIARLVHDLSRRNGEIFLDINCAALTPQLLESELFGHERGAFTDAREAKRGLLEVASNGTVFLDEIIEMDGSVQTKLLKAIEEKSFRRLGGLRDINVDVRLIAASQLDLAEAVAAGRFRPELFYRLNVFQIFLPPLRERREDILEIAMFFVKELNPVLGRQVTRIAEPATNLLLSYHWPGNVRELRNVIERAMIFSQGDTIGPETLSPGGLRRSLQGAAQHMRTLAEVEATHIRNVLAATGGNVKRASAVLGIARSTLYAKLKAHKIGAADE